MEYQPISEETTSGRRGIKVNVFACECNTYFNKELFPDAETLNETCYQMSQRKMVNSPLPVCNLSSNNGKCNCSSSNKYIPYNGEDIMTLDTEPTVKFEALPTDVVNVDIIPEAKQLSVVNHRAQRDERQVVEDMRLTLGPSFATAGLIMAAKIQYDVLNSQVGAATDTEISDPSEEQRRKTPFSFKRFTLLSWKS